MKNKFFWGLVWIAMAFFFVSPADANEAKIFKFKAKTWGSVSYTTDRLNGEYEVVVVGKEAEVFFLSDGQRVPIGGNSAAELLRMVGIDPDNRMYVDPSGLAVGKKWSAEHRYQSSGRVREIRRNVEYEVISKEQKETPAGTFEVFKIEGNVLTRGTPQKWVYYYAPAISTGTIVHWQHDSAVGREGGKIEIEFQKLNTATGQARAAR